MELPESFSITTEVWMVPCRVTQKKQYLPLCNPLDDIDVQDLFRARNAWRLDEDQILLELINFRGPKNWSGIAKELNTRHHDSISVRKGKQCRERWFNHLNPSLIKTQWSSKEDLILIEKQQELGNRWSQIAKFLLGRTENQIKNRWKSFTKKACKKRKKGRPTIRIVRPPQELVSNDYLNLDSGAKLDEKTPYDLESIDSSPLSLGSFCKSELELPPLNYEGLGPVRTSSLTSDPDLIASQNFEMSNIKSSKMDLDYFDLDKKIDEGNEGQFYDVFSFNHTGQFSLDENLTYFTSIKKEKQENKFISDGFFFIQDPIMSPP